MIINQFALFLNLICSAILAFWYIRREDWQRQIARNDKLNIDFKNNFNLVVMSVIQFNFLYLENVYDT